MVRQAAGENSKKIKIQTSIIQTSSNLCKICQLIHTEQKEQSLQSAVSTSE